MARGVIYQNPIVNNGYQVHRISNVARIWFTSFHQRPVTNFHSIPPDGLTESLSTKCQSQNTNVNKITQHNYK